MSDRVDTFIAVLYEDADERGDDNAWSLPGLLDMDREEVQELLTRLVHPDEIMKNPYIQTIEQVLGLAFSLGTMSGVQAERRRSLAAMWEEHA